MDLHVYTHLQCVPLSIRTHWLNLFFFFYVYQTSDGIGVEEGDLIACIEAELLRILKLVHSSYKYSRAACFQTLWPPFLLLEPLLTVWVYEQVISIMTSFAVMTADIVFCPLPSLSFNQLPCNFRNSHINSQNRSLHLSIDTVLKVPEVLFVLLI